MGMHRGSAGSGIRHDDGLARDEAGESVDGRVVNAVDLLHDAPPAEIRSLSENSEQDDLAVFLRNRSSHSMEGARGAAKQQRDRSAQTSASITLTARTSKRFTAVSFASEIFSEMIP
jgi:hypothetical protein